MNKKAYFEILRPGINSTLQDLGRENQYHLGIPFSGAMDKRNYLICNQLVSNIINKPALEFAYQGPRLKLKSGKATCAISGNVSFNIIKNNKTLEGKCYETFDIGTDDEIDILSTNKSVYGYLSVHGGFEGESFWGSCSINTKAKIGSNNGMKYSKDQNIFLTDAESISNKKKIDYMNSKIEYIRVLKGTNFNYFSDEAIRVFFGNKFVVSKLLDRMGMRLEGPKIKNNVSTNIKSEGLVKGVIQVPADGNPIIMLSDHGTIGGYPKIGVIISADYDKIVQSTPGSNIKFKLVDLPEAENLYKLYNMDTQNLLNQIR